MRSSMIAQSLFSVCGGWLVGEVVCGVGGGVSVVWWGGGVVWGWFGVGWVCRCRCLSVSLCIFQHFI